MTITVHEHRIFKYGQLVLEDPDPNMSLEEVKDFYADIYPELTQSNVEGPEIKDDGVEYEFRKSAGTKGKEETTVSIGDIANKKKTVPMHTDIAVCSELMQSVGRILLDASPDIDDNFLAPCSMQGVIL